MDRKKCGFALQLGVIIITIVLLCTGGCLQKFVPRLLRETDGENGNIAGEEGNGKTENSPGELPAGVLDYQVYLVEEKSHYLLPVTVLQPWTEGVARAALEKLITGPAPAEEMRFGLVSPLPVQAEIRGVNIRGGLCRADFSRDFLDYDPGREREVLGSVVHTLQQFDSVGEVEIVVEGETVDYFPGGTPGRGAFDWRYTLNPEGAEEEENGAQIYRLRLFFCTLLGENHIFYVPITRTITGKGELIQATVEELIKGPSSGSHLFSELPPGAELYNYSLREGLLVADFSRELLNYRGGRSGEENIKNQLVLTLLALPGVERVQILVEGEKLLFPHGISFQNPLAPPLLVNRLN